MVKAKARTLKRFKRASKKTYLLKGGQNNLEFINLYNSFNKSLTTKKELYDSIKNNASAIYDSKTTQKNDIFRMPANDIIVFLETFYQTAQEDVEQKRITLKQNLLEYPVKYNQYFIEINISLDCLLNEINDIVDYARNLNSKFQNKEVHVHLIQSNFNMLNNIKLQVNNLNERLQSLLDSLDKTYKLVKEQIEPNNVEGVETYKRNIQDAISTVNRPMPEGFVPNSNTKFIKGCPLGTVLENNQCVYYNGSNIIESVPFQENLTNTNSEYVVWFNQINQQSVGIPTVFKKKPVEYLLPLTEEDSKLYKTKYVVAEQNGSIKLDRNGMKKFVNDINCCWNQDSGVTSTSDNESFYTDYDNLPQPVKLLETIAPVVRKNLSSIKYIRLLNEEDQILSGIQYIETDISGNIIYNNSSVIPFYPELNEFIFSNNTFTKNAYNNVDTFKVILLEGTLNRIPELNSNINTEYDTGLLNSFKYNIIPVLFVNKYVRITVDKFYSPFVLPSVLLNEGDYFLIHNTSTDYPIIFNISKGVDESRVVLYPNEIYCFIYSNDSDSLQYGFIKYNLHDTFYTKTNKVAKISPLNKYVFVETKDIYDGETFIMNSIEPILDSQKRVIVVPNFNETDKIFYDFDDIFQINPIQVQIIEPQVKVVNNKTFDSGKYPNLEESKEHLSYISPYITRTTTGILLFCDESGKPRIDLLGYFIPVITPVFYNGTNYFWLNYEKEISLEFKKDYIDTILVDLNYLAENQFRTTYYSTYNSMNGGQSLVPAPAPAPAIQGQVPVVQGQSITLYTNKDSKPLVSKAKNYIIAEDISNLNMLSTTIPNTPSFSSEIVNIKEIQDSINKVHLSNSVEIYVENTNLLIHQYTDISGNMNNLEELKLQLQYQIQLNTKESLEEARKIYTKVLETHNKLKTFIKQREEIQLKDLKIQELKQIRNNELKVIETSINNLEKTLLPLNSRILDDTSKRDYSILYETLKKLRNAYDSLNYSIDSMNNYDTLKNQEQNTKLLMNSINVLETNIRSFEEYLKQKEVELSQAQLKIKEGTILDLQKILQGNIDLTNELKSRRNEVNEISKNQFDSYFTNVDIISDFIKNDKIIIVNTLDTIDKRISNYELNIKNINNIKQNIQNLLELNRTDSIKQIQEAKLILNKKIAAYKIEHDNIKSLLNSLNISNEEEFDNQLRNFNTEILGIESSIANENDLTMLQSKNTRIDEINNLENSILTELQTIEQNTTSESVRLQSSSPEPINLEPLVTPQLGGKSKKRWQTRKHKSSSKDKSTRKDKSNHQ